MATFLEELEEHVRHFNQELLILEKNPPFEERAERLKTLFRTVHSLKGAARSVNVDLIEGACHRLEEILARVRDANTGLSPELAALLFAVADALEEAGMRLREQQDLADAPLADLLPRLEAAANGARTEAVTPAAAAAALRRGGDCRTDAGTERRRGQRARSRRKARFAPGPRGRIAHCPAPRGGARQRPGRPARFRGPVADRMESVASRFFALARPPSNGKRRRSPSNRSARRAAHLLRVGPTAWQTGENLRRLDRSLERLAGAMASDARLFEHIAQPLEDEVHRVRMLPFTDACAGLHRMVRDLAQATHKEVELRIEGGAVELDRSILEGLKDPLRHLVRNALDHGVELPADRQNAGKPRQGTITVAAALRGAQVEVNVRDDGRGLDLEAIRAQARRRKIDEPADERELARLIFQPGFSTAGIITDISGRGVGLDVVKNRVENLHGAVDLAFTAGQATCFTLTVPLTLTTLRALLDGGRRPNVCADLSATNVQKAHQDRGDRHPQRGGPGDAELQRRAAAGGGPGLDSRCGELRAGTTPERSRALIVVAAGTATRMAFLVDEHLAEQEILIKNLGVRIQRAPFVSGATLLLSGQVALVLNAANLVRSVLRQGGAWPRRTDPPKTPAAARKRLLIVEDSMTTRALMKSILEAAGYEILTAADGQAAWQRLQETGVDLVVSDVDMPNMDGFALTAAARASKKHAELPIILVTARESDSDKLRGIEVGADAYLVKSAFDQRNLLETIRQML